ncbi:MAG: hypothetical protein M1821_003896 [Bathelium mastoideum]|nr:MAG: hypothetical protein M1821_003896 [Bathelium mastoideum]
MLEIACFNIESAYLAYEAGADRIELCTEYQAGGVTPNYEDLTLLRSRINVAIFVMIRPRAGSFCYSDSELEQMKVDILRFKDAADGFVFGVLGEDRKVQVAKNAQLVALANPKPCTFHRALDLTPDLFQALEDVIKCGFRTILTSGGHASATMGMEKIAKLVEQSKDRISIMPGGGVRSSNIQELKSVTGSQWLHSSAITGQGEVVDAHEVWQMKAKS